MNKLLKEYTETHYKNKDYTEVVRDALLCLTTEMRNKAGLDDGDGVSLINKVFSDKDPLIRINKLETDTEKNKQRGIADISKGLIEYFRNPMSHDKQVYSKEIADAIITLLDEVVLKEIIGSKGANGIEDWFNDIKGELFPNTLRYAKTLVNTIPENKRFDLAVMLYHNRAELIGDKYNIIFTLSSSLKKDKYKEYCKVIETDLFGDITKEQVILSLNFIDINIWNELSDLIKVKIEDMILEDIKLFSVNYNLTEIKGEVLFKNSLKIIKYFSNKQEIFDIILEKMANDEANGKYLGERYLNIIINEDTLANSDFIIFVERKMSLKTQPIYFKKMKILVEGLNKKCDWYKKLKPAFEKKEKETIQH